MNRIDAGNFSNLTDRDKCVLMVYNKNDVHDRGTNPTISMEYADCVLHSELANREQKIAARNGCKDCLFHQDSPKGKKLRQKFLEQYIKQQQKILREKWDGDYLRNPYGYDRGNPVL